MKTGLLSTLFDVLGVNASAFRMGGMGPSFAGYI